MSNQHTAIPMPQRFWSHVVQWGDDCGWRGRCWTWIGPHQRIGFAHRVAYELSVGPVPDGMELDHLCGNRGCVNPGHLEPVTRRENVMRSRIATVALAAEPGGEVARALILGWATAETIRSKGRRRDPGGRGAPAWFLEPWHLNTDYAEA